MRDVGGSYARYDEDNHPAPCKPERRVVAARPFRMEVAMARGRTYPAHELYYAYAADWKAGCNFPNVLRHEIRYVPVSQVVRRVVN